MIFKKRIRGKQSPEATGNTLAELNDLDKAKTSIILPNFINKNSSKIGSARGQSMCFKCRTRKECTEYKDWAEISKNN